MCRSTRRVSLRPPMARWLSGRRQPPWELVDRTRRAFDGELTFLKRDGSVSSRFGGVQKFN